jgi:hypothetical protein
MKRLTQVVFVAALILIGFSGCDIVLDMLGLNLDDNGAGGADLTVEITLTANDTVRVTVRNPGSSYATNAEYQLYYSTDRNITANDAQVHTGTTSVAPGDSEVITVEISQFSVPTTVAAGNYYIGVKVDTAFQVSESNEDNNSGITTTTYSYTPGTTGGGTANGVPLMPLNLTVGNPTSNSLTVSWGSEVGATGYTVYRDTLLTGPNMTDEYTGPNTSFTDSALASGVTYYYWVKATNSYGSSSLAGPVSGTTATGLVVNAQQSHAISTQGDVDWYSFNASAGSSFRIETGSTGGMPIGDTILTLIGIDGVTVLDSNDDVDISGGNYYSAIDFSPAVGGSYYIIVEGFGGTTVGDYSIVVNMTSPPLMPLGLTVGNPTTSSLDISWNSEAGAASYTLYRDTQVSGATKTDVYIGSDTYYSDTALPQGTTYYYWVAAANGYGSSPLAGPISDTTQSLTVLQYTAFDDWEDHSLQTGEQLTIHFQVTQGYQYAIYWNDSYAGDTSQTGDILVTAYQTDSSTYYAVDQSGDSGFSSGDDFYEVDSAYTTTGATVITAVDSGTVYLSITGYAGSVGTFRLVVTMTAIDITSEINGVWTGQDIAQYNAHWFTFDTVPGDTYTVSWDDLIEGSGSYSGDVIVWVYKSDWSTLYSAAGGEDSGYSTGFSFTATDTIARVEVRPYTPATSYGTYGLLIESAPAP